MSETTRHAPGLDGSQEALGTLLERALQGDGQALDVLVTLLKTRHYKRLVSNLHHSRKKASTQTIEDAFQDSIVELVEKVRSGDLRDLSEEDREDVLEYFFKVCDRRIADRHRPRRSPLAAREKEEVPIDVVDQQTPMPGDGATTEHRMGLVKSAMMRLDPLERRILERVLEGIPYEAVAREIGKSPIDVNNIVARAKQRLLMDILPKSETAQLNYERDRQAAYRKPTWEEVKAAVDALPPELKGAVTAVHLEGKSIEEFAGKLGTRGHQKALVRLKQACRILSTRLRAEFPKAFQEISK